MKTGKKIMIIVASAIIGAAAAVIFACTFDIMKVQGDSMDPKVKDGSYVLINRMAYFYGSPDTGEVVAFRCPVYSEDGEGSILLRRVAAIEGDKVKISDGCLYINGIRYEDYVAKGVYLDPMDEITVGQNRVFVISDTGQAVLDSRDSAVGQLRTDELMGRVWFK